MNLTKNQIGGIQLRIIFAVVTFIGIAVLLVFFMNRNSEVAQENHRKATLLSDKGIQIFMESNHKSLLDSPLSVKGIKKEEYQDGWYEVKVKNSIKDSICLVSIKSTGGYNKSKVSQEKNIKLVCRISANDTVWTPYTE